MLKTYPTTVPQLQIRALAAAFGAPSSLAAAFGRTPFVQADPIRAPARAQDLILRQRVQGYAVGDLDRAYHRLGLEEFYLHAYGFGTAGLRALLHPRHDQESPDGRHRPTGLAADVLAFVGDRTATHPRDLAAAFGRETARNAWGGLSKATTRALDALLHHGLLRVVSREGGIRVYGPIPQVDQELAPAERLSRLALVTADLLAPVQAATLSAIMSRLARSLFGPGWTALAGDAVRLSDTLVALESDGVRYVVRDAAGVPALSGRRRVRFLAPFDPLVWDRRRFEHLWGWPYRFEAYVPPDRRRLGYYAMPLSWGDHVIGWVNCTRAGGVLDLRAGYVANQDRGPSFAKAFDDEAARLAIFLRPTSQAQPLVDQAAGP